MKFEVQMFILLVVIGLTVKKFTWRSSFFLTLLLATWIFYNLWKGGK